MLQHRPLLYYLCLMCLIAAVSCGEGATNAKDTDVDTTSASDTPSEDDVKFDINPSRSVVKFKGELFNIPSPIQTIMLIKENDVDYDEELLSGLNRSNEMISETQKALNVGILGVDLAYLSNFEKAQSSLSYLKELESLASDLDISDNIDRSIVERFSANVGNKDSLYTLNSEFYRAGYRYLKENERNKVSSLILLGGWVEAMHYASHSADENDKIRTRIIEQGQPIKSLIALCGSMENDEQLGQMLSVMKRMESLYDSLVEDYTYVEPITDRSERKTYFNSLSSVIADDQQMNEFKAMILELRNVITQ